MRHAGILAGMLLAACADADVRPSSPDILLVSIDGLRADRTHLGGNPRTTTPSLDALATTGVVFDTALSTSNESLFSHAAMLTGRYPREVGSLDYLSMVVPPAAWTLAEALSAVGYDTAAFTSGGHVKASFGFGQGFGRVVEGQDYGSLRDSVGPALAWLDAPRESSRPTFLFVQGYDCHQPYLHGSVFHHVFADGPAGRVDDWLARRNFVEGIHGGVYYPDYPLSWQHHAVGERILDPAVYRALPVWAAQAGPDAGLALTSQESEHLRAHYDGAVLEADTYLGLLLDGLAARGRLAHTLVVVTSDHGEDLGTHGTYNHRAGVWDSTTRVPLVLAGAIPEALRGRRPAGAAQALDLVPTLLAAAGTVPPAGTHGVDLLAMAAGRVAPPEVVYQHGVLGQLSARTERWRLTFDGGDLGDPATDARLEHGPLATPDWTLHDRAADPDERHDVLAAHPDVAARLREGLVRWWTDLPDGVPAAPPSPEDRAMLRRNGYW
jgi:arylsulfatase A-like enzyme